VSDRIFNFSAGPAVLPESVLRQAQKDLWNVRDSGIGVAEHSHRGKVFDKIFAETEAAARELGGIPDNYKVLFLQGGATLQFSMVPMCLLPKGRTADYLNTGVWSQKAIAEAKKVGDVHIAASSEDTKFDRIPDVASIRYSANPAYVHFTSNNTIYGTQWTTEPPVPAGASFYVVPRLGVEHELLPKRLRLRTGAWLEPNLVRGSQLRPHVTFGFEVFTLRVIDDWSISAALDAAPRYFAASVGIGWWR